VRLGIVEIVNHNHVRYHCNGLSYLYLYHFVLVAMINAKAVEPERTSDLAFTRYCHRQYCIVYGIQKVIGPWGGVYCEMGVH